MPTLITTGAASARGFGLGGVPGRRWSSIVKGANIALSGNGLIATRGGGVGWESVLGTGAAVGTYTFSITVTASTNQPLVGFANASLATGSYVGATADSLGLKEDGDVYYNAGVLGNVGFTFASGDTLTFEINTGAVTYRVKKNAGGYTAPANYSGVPGTVYPAAGLFDTASTATGVF